MPKWFSLSLNFFFLMKEIIVSVRVQGGKWEGILRKLACKRGWKRKRIVRVDLKSKMNIPGKRNMNQDMKQKMADWDCHGWLAWSEDAALKEEEEWKLRTRDRQGNATLESIYFCLLLLLLLSHFSRVRLCATPQTAAHQAPPGKPKKSKNVTVLGYKSKQNNTLYKLLPFGKS